MPPSGSILGLLFCIVASLDIPEFVYLDHHCSSPACGRSELRLTCAAHDRCMAWLPGGPACISACSWTKAQRVQHINVRTSFRKSPSMFLVSRTFSLILAPQKMLRIGTNMAKPWSTQLSPTISATLPAVKQGKQ